eukprot:TRINITY_DN752_c0_g2_i6.p1 TRINITY_DN752_c0_g2~~TRINITY_DN752_c0_g2_i6.p1  ORF type:complete len:176 (+),score=8.22 TRINITY_DN752_c0_g2_i6:86-613(+)
MLLIQYWALVSHVHIYRLILTLMYSYPCFQIFHSASRTSTNPLTPRYIVTMGVTRLALPLYLFFCPSNFAFIKWDPTFSISLIIWFAFQNAVLYLQEIKGPQFFVFSFMVPKKYDYFQSVSLSEIPDCVICRCEIEAQERYMVTPCNHIFHEQCLTTWFETKLQCPTCRAQVPLP